MIKRSSFAIFAVVLLCSCSMLLVIDDFNSNKSTITYIVDGVEYTTMDVINNTLLKLPEVPEKLGFTGKWDVDEKNLTVKGNTTINAIYTRFAYAVKFESDYPELFQTYVYDTDSYDNPKNTNYGYSKDSKTGEFLTDGNGQLNFEIKTVSGFNHKIEASGGYTNIKTTDNDNNIRTNCYKITKITSDIIVKITPILPLNISHDSGFYSDSFDLTMSSPGTIHYTLDGTEPSIDSPIYEKSIRIEDATYNDNNYCKMLTYYQPNSLIDKCTILRAVSFLDNGIKSEVVSKSYFVDYDNRDEYSEIGIMSIITDPSNLFDEETGIFTEENRYNKGLNWEKEVSVQIFDNDHSLQLSQNCGLRVHGSGSRQYLPFSITLYARDEYGNDRFSTDLFGTGFEAQRIILNAGGNENKTKILDKMVSEFTEDFNVSVCHYIPNAVFVNGELYGFCWMTEKYDEEYFTYYHEVEKDNILMIKNGLVEEGNDMYYTEYENFINVYNLDMTDQSSIDILSTKVDLESLVDYYAIELFVGNWDCYPGLPGMSNNYAMWQIISPLGYKESNGKWKFVIFDLNAIVYTIDTNDYSYFINEAITSDIVLKQLIKNDTFKAMIKEKLLVLCELFNADNIRQYVETYTQKYMGILCKEYERYYTTHNRVADYYQEHMEKMIQYFNNRILMIKTFDFSTLQYQ